jgi:hypothetical protein
VKPLLHCLLALLVVTTGSADDRTLPAQLDSAASPRPPQIDGRIDQEEWAAATPHTVDVVFIRLDPPVTEKRACELRVMNSANALYVALTVPDETVDDSLSPFRLDAAILAFSSGDELKPGSDRKLVATNLYRDKHITSPGKDDDDAQQDGAAALRRQDGRVQIEWAVPLAAKDKNDLQAKPGDDVRFNIGYFDAFQLPLTSTFAGGLYGADLNVARHWGVLRLAKNVEDDGGAAFRGPGWIEAARKTVNELAPKRLRVTSESSLASTLPGAAMLGVTVQYSDPNGKPAEAKSKIYFPPNFDPAAPTKYPLYFVAGYEAPDASVVPFLARNWIVVSPASLPTNPLVRLKNPDVAMLHLARRLPWIDDACVMIGGGSAGGWMTLHLAAETFPLAGAMPDVPPVNWGYNAAYFFTQADKAGPAKGETAARVPVLFAVGSMLTGSVKVHGDDYNDATWFASSPVAHADTITCPVSVYWSTADVLVPIDQVGRKFVQGLEPNQFPDGFTMEIDKLMTSREGRLTLLEALSENDYEIFPIEVPKGTRRQNSPEGSGKVEVRELPVSPTRRWSITIIDEGRPLADVDHRKYALVTTRNDFLTKITTTPIAVDQLTTPKLQRLMARYAGQEWLSSRLKHLDDPTAEKQDVLRGLKTYTQTSPAHREQFQKLYEALPKIEQLLSDDELVHLNSSTR